MKKKLLGSAVLSIVACTMIAAPTYAAVNETVKTDTDVTFKEDVGAKTPVKPGTNTPVTPPTDAGKTGGTLRVEVVPSIHFGDVKISPMTKDIPAIYTSYKDAKGVDVYLPHYAQVTDARGVGPSGNSPWSLTVQQDDYLASGTEKLLTSRIYIRKQKLYNTKDLATGVTGTPNAEKLTGVGKAITEDLGNNTKIGVATATGENPLHVLGTSGNVDTSISSVVFNKDYNPSVASTATATTTNSDLVLRVESADSPKKDIKYTAKLTWTLTDSY